MKMRFLFSVTCSLVVLVSSCSPSAFIKKSAKTLVHQPALENAHVGIAVYDATAGKSVYNYQADKYFVPASNTKIFTLYAALKTFRDSLPGIRYRETADAVYVYPTGDPSFLHPDFKSQPVFSFLRQLKKPIILNTSAWNENAYGMGWSWDDYNDDYMVERSPLPIYGNVIRWIQSVQKGEADQIGGQTFVFSEPEVNWKLRFIEDRYNKVFTVQRKKDENVFEAKQGIETMKTVVVPFITHGVESALQLLKDTLGKELTVQTERPTKNDSTNISSVVFSQATDSLYRLMMNRSDNFFAEQLLLMVSNERSGVMSDAKIINDLLKHELKDLPQKPNWVDGSGLSRYNLFSPTDFVWILEKMEKEFGLERLKSIFPTGNRGTLKSYFVSDSLSIYAKTGTLSATVALSGFLITPKNKLLAFSVLVNNHQAGATAVRRAVETFLSEIRKKY